MVPLRLVNVPSHADEGGGKVDTGVLELVVEHRRCYRGGVGGYGSGAIGGSGDVVSRTGDMLGAPLVRKEGGRGKRGQL